MPSADSPAIGLLDTGVNRAHPLLADVISEADAQTLKPSWGSQNSYPTGHGTQMAGLGIYGDLATVLADDNPITLTHGVQSLKLIHDSDPHRPELYGTVTIEGISSWKWRLRGAVTIASPSPRMPEIVASPRRGRPIDNLACGAINDTQQLITSSSRRTLNSWNAPITRLIMRPPRIRPCSSLERAYRRRLHRKGIRQSRQESGVGTPSRLKGI